MTVSADQLKCLEQARYDVLTFYWANGWQATAPHLAIYSDWFNRLKSDALAGNAVAKRDAAYAYASLEDYATALNCSAPKIIQSDPNTSPGSGNYAPGAGTSSPVATAPPRTGVQTQWAQAVTFLEQNPLVAIGGVALLFLIFYKPGDVTFAR